MKILYEDDDIIAVLKPCGVSVQQDLNNDKTVIDYLSHYLSVKNEEIHVINRLDKPVSGIVLFCKNKFSAGNMSGQMQAHKLNKIYLAVAEGDVLDRGTLKDWIVKNQRLNVSKVVNPGTRGAKEAELHYEKLDEAEEKGKIFSLCAVTLVTGRHHQIRVQFLNAGFPLWGDKKYNKDAKFIQGFTEIALFSYQIVFTHPRTGKAMGLTAPIPQTYPFSLFYPFTSEFNSCILKNKS